MYRKGSPYTTSLHTNNLVQFSLTPQIFIVQLPCTSPLWGTCSQKDPLSFSPRKNHAFPFSQALWRQSKTRLFLLDSKEEILTLGAFNCGVASYLGCDTGDMRAHLSHHSFVLWLCIGYLISLGGSESYLWNGDYNIYLSHNISFLEGKFKNNRVVLKRIHQIARFLTRIDNGLCFIVFAFNSCMYF